jgi:aspartyl-tRNA(Asn)/glutamyl-tRNA(Gln) amidotransferase subunit C
VSEHFGTFTQRRSKGMVWLMLTREEVLKIARLARLKLTDVEVDLYRERLARVLDYIHELNQVKTPSDAFVKHVPKDSVAFREDVAIAFADTESLLANAAESEEGHFLLPPIMERE